MMNNSDKYNLLRFVEAQETYGIYDIAVSELERGRKRSHWIWFVFPQMKGLGYSYNSNYYGITCREEAEAYLENKILNERLRKVCRILLEQVRGGRSVHQILGGIIHTRLSLASRSLMPYCPMISLRNVWRYAIKGKGMKRAWIC